MCYRASCTSTYTIRLLSARYMPEEKQNGFLFGGSRYVHTVARNKADKPYNLPQIAHVSWVRVGSVLYISCTIYHVTTAGCDLDDI